MAREPEIATVMAVTVDDLKAWHEKTVVPNNMIVGVDGDFDSAAMEQKLRAAFEGLPRGTALAESQRGIRGTEAGRLLGG